VSVNVVIAVGAPSLYAGTLTETMRESDIKALHQAIAAASGLGNVTPEPIQLAAAWTAPPVTLKADSLSTYANLLGRLTDVYALSGFEGPMRDAIQRTLPAWALELATEDTAGNLVVATGPDRDTTVVVAHMDEIGFLVTRIARDGTLSLRPRGTFFPFLYEGQPALLHRADDKIPGRNGPQGCGAARGGPLRGIFIPRDSSTQRQPAALTAWFGLDSAALVAAGVTVGSPLTSYKCATRLGDMRITARSIDDRAGVTALLMALNEITPATLDHKVIFVFSVREEGGLEGTRGEPRTIRAPRARRRHVRVIGLAAGEPAFRLRADRTRRHGSRARQLECCAGGGSRTGVADRAGRRHSAAGGSNQWRERRIGVGAIRGGECGARVAAAV
jgi:hypothetical protein